MDDEITAGGIGGLADRRSVRRLVQVQIGNATVFVEQLGAPVEVDVGDEIHPVALPSPQEALERAGDLLQELVRIFDARIRALASRPKEVSVEFSLGFEVKGKATLIPILLSGETSTQAAIKVSAAWDIAASQS
jgi:hypothetical protein